MILFFKEMYGIDLLHKFNWIRLIARMFEAMAGNFAHSSDVQLFLNVINGSLALHTEDCCILRYANTPELGLSETGYFLKKLKI